MAGPSLTSKARTIEVRSPRDGKLVAAFPVGGPREVEEAVSSARAAMRSWASRSPLRRVEALERLGAVLEEQSEEIADAIVAETGKPRVEALAEVAVSVELIRYYHGHAPRHLNPRRVGTGWMVWKKGWVEREPLGVIGAITPWNYPLIIAMDVVVAALAGGNGVVVKPSELTPIATSMLPDLCAKAGLPDGLVQVVTGDGTTGEALVRSGVDKLSFTGSTEVGRRVMAVASETLTPVTLELGGKDAAIVLDDADLERTARGIAFGGFFNAGQTCISIERVYVVEAVAADFIARLGAEADALRWGVGDDVDVGPMISRAQFEKVASHIRDAVEKGAEVVSGGVPEPGGRVIAPTVLAGVDDSMIVSVEETFGPVLAVTVVRDEEEAVLRTNASDYGLFASVWTQNRRRGVDVGRRLRAGGVCINETLAHVGVGGLPLGGVGESGFGSRRGLAGLSEVTRLRTFFSDRAGARREPWWFPYGERARRLTRSVLALRGQGGLKGLFAAVGRLLGR